MGRYSWFRFGSFLSNSSAYDDDQFRSSHWIFCVCAAAYLLDYRQHPRLSSVVAVSSNSQVDFLVKVILPVSSHQAEERVFRRLGDIVSVKDGGITAVHMGFYVGEPGERFRCFWGDGGWGHNCENLAVPKIYVGSSGNGESKLRWCPRSNGFGYGAYDWLDWEVREI